MSKWEWRLQGVFIVLFGIGMGVFGLWMGRTRNDNSYVPTEIKVATIAPFFALAAYSLVVLIVRWRR